MNIIEIQNKIISEKKKLKNRSKNYLSNFKNIEGANFFVLVSKKKPIWWNTVILSNKKEWIVFPWENKKNELKEENDYNKKRGLK